MGLLTAPFFFAAKAVIGTANVAHALLWRNRGTTARMFTAAAALVGAGTLMELNKDDGVPDPRQAPDSDAYYNNTPMASTGNDAPQVSATPAAPGTVSTLAPGGVLPQATPEAIVNTYLTSLYDPKTAAWLNSVPENERAAQAALIAANRDRLEDALLKFERIQVPQDMLREAHQRQLDEARASYPDRSEDFYLNMLSPMAVIEMRLRAQLLTQMHPELAVNEEEGASLDKRLKMPSGYNYSRSTSIISYLTDGVEARAMGLRSYHLDREFLVHRANENVVIPAPSRNGPGPAP